MFGGGNVYVCVSNLNYVEVTEKRDHLVEKVRRGYEHCADEDQEESYGNGTEYSFIMSTSISS
jgi:hypothetical protein